MTEKAPAEEIIEDDVNLIKNSTAVFIEYYNSNIPASFPLATTKVLNEFQAEYPSLFKDDNKWVINKHRKKLMDWMISHRED